MISEIYSNLILKAAKVKLEPYDIFQKEDTYTWIDDNDWFLTIIEFIHSVQEKEIFLNTGLNFLWHRKKIFTFDFFKEETSIKYDSEEDFYDKSLQLMQIAINKALFYRKFRKLDFAKEQILSTQYNVWKFNYYKMIICFLCDDVENGKKYFKLFSNNVGLNNESNLFIEEQKKLYNPLVNVPEKMKQTIIENSKKNIFEQRLFYNKNFLSKLKTEELYILK